MDEEYGSSSFVRDTTDKAPRRVTGKGGRRVKFSGDSYSSFTENMSKKRDKKIEKYNREYNELKRLAEEVNNKREKAESSGNYGDVARSIKAYNKQAKRLAKVGVAVLSFDKDVIKYKEGAAGKPIRVPGFLIGPMKMLSSAARKQSEVDTKLESSILSAAKNAVGKNPENTVDDEAILQSLSLENMVETAKVEAGITPAPDDREEKDHTSDEPTPDEILREEEERRKAEVARIEQEEAEKAAKREKMKRVTSAKMQEKSAERKRKHDEAQKRKEDSKHALSATPFDIAKGIDSSFAYSVTKKDDKTYGLLSIRTEKGLKPLGISDFMEMVRIPADEKEVGKSAYTDTVALTYLVARWKNTFKDSELSDERKDSFNAYVELLSTSKTKEEFMEKLTSSEVLTAEEKEKIKLSVEKADYKMLKRGTTTIAPLSLDKEETKGDETVDRVKVVREKVYPVIKKHAMAKYGIEPPVDEETEEDELDPEEKDEGTVTLTSDDTASKDDDGVRKGVDETDPVVKPEETVSEEERKDPKPVEKPTVVIDPDSYVGKIGIITEALAGLAKAKKELSDSGLSVETQIAKIDEQIKEKLSELDALLGVKRVEKKEDETSEIETDPIHTEKDEKRTGTDPDIERELPPAPEDVTSTTVTDLPEETKGDSKAAEVDDRGSEEVGHAPVAWWESMMPALNNPEVIKGVEIRDFEQRTGTTATDYEALRSKEALERAEAEAREAVIRREEEEKRQQLIERNRARAAENRAKIEEFNRISAEKEAERKRVQAEAEEKARAEAEEKRAYEILTEHMGFEGLDEGIKAVDMLAEIKEKAPKAYEKAIESYNASKEETEPSFKR